MVCSHVRGKLIEGKSRKRKKSRITVKIGKAVSSSCPKSIETGWKLSVNALLI